MSTLCSVTKTKEHLMYINILSFSLKKSQRLSVDPYNVAFYISLFNK